MIKWVRIDVFSCCDSLLWHPVSCIMTVIFKSISVFSPTDGWSTFARLISAQSLAVCSRSAPSVHMSLLGCSSPQGFWEAFTAFKDGKLIYCLKWNTWVTVKQTDSASGSLQEKLELSCSLLLLYMEDSFNINSFNISILMRKNICIVWHSRMKMHTENTAWSHCLFIGNWIQYNKMLMQRFQDS